MFQEIPRQWPNVRRLPSKASRPAADDTSQSTSSQILTPFITRSLLPYLIWVSLTNVSFWFPSTSPRLTKCHFRCTKLKLTLRSKIRVFLRFLQGSRRYYTLLAHSWNGREKLCSHLVRTQWNCTIPWPYGSPPRTHQGRNRLANLRF